MTRLQQYNVENRALRKLFQAVEELSGPAKARVWKYATDLLFPSEVVADEAPPPPPISIDTASSPDDAA